MFKSMAFLGKGALAVTTVAVGLGAGTQVNDWAQTRTAGAYSTSQTAPAGDGPVAALDDPATADSLFHYNFIPGQRLDYGLDATIAGTGAESMVGPGNVAMRFWSDLYVQTEGVDVGGNGNLSIGFDRVEMNGSFMDGPVNLVHSVAGTEFSHGNDAISTAQGDSIAGIPQLQFFNKPTKVRVSPAGEVLSVSGAPGMEKMLAPEQILTSVQFPSGDLDAGAQWESDFAMPIPGFGTPVGSKTLNVLEGFELFRGRYCGVVRQTIISEQQEGTVNSPESALGEEMNFSLPEFKLSGENLIYFDVDNGQLVEADMNLRVTMRIGQQLKPMMDALNVYGKLLNDMDGTKSEDGESESLLDMGLNIDATLVLLTD